MATSKTLAQVVGTRKAIAARATSDLTAVKNEVEKADRFAGLVRTYAPIEDGGDAYPPENKAVLSRHADVLNQMVECERPWLNTIAAVEFANQAACADVVVGDTVVIQSAPVPLLLALIKRVTDMRTLLEKIPVLPEGESWSWNTAEEVYETPAAQTRKTTRKQTPVVLYEATKEHPAQVQLLPEDVLVGHWTTIKQSGAMLARQKRDILVRTDALIDALKHAVEAANRIPCPPIDVASGIFEYLNLFES